MPAAPPLHCERGGEIVDNLNTPINRAGAGAWHATAAERLISAANTRQLTRSRMLTTATKSTELARLMSLHA
jgi:hypothetical protein